MKKIVSTMMVFCVVALGIAIFTGHDKEVQAAAVEVITAKAVPKFNAIAYISGHGGHLAILDLRTMVPPVDVDNDRIVLTEAGSEMEGIIAGMSFEEVQQSGGSHGQAMVKEKGEKILVAGTLNGDVYKVNLTSGKKEGPFKVGQKFCGAIAGPDGNIYFQDMADGHVYVWDSATLKTVDKMPVGAAVCGIQWTKNAKKAYITDMPTGIVYVYDWTTKKEIKQIKSPEMTFIHQARMTPDFKELWVSAPNEFDPELAAGTHKSQIVIIDTEKDEVSKRIVLPDDVRPHDFAFSADDAYVLLASRTYGDDSTLNIMERDSKALVGQISACAACHFANGIEVKIDNSSPLLCGLTMDWNPTDKSAGKQAAPAPGYGK